MLPPTYPEVPQCRHRHHRRRWFRCERIWHLGNVAGNEHYSVLCRTAVPMSPCRVRTCSGGRRRHLQLLPSLTPWQKLPSRPRGRSAHGKQRRAGVCRVQASHARGLPQWYPSPHCLTRRQWRTTPRPPPQPERLVRGGLQCMSVAPATLVAVQTLAGAAQSVWHQLGVPRSGCARDDSTQDHERTLNDVVLLTWKHARVNQPRTRHVTSQAGLCIFMGEGYGTPPPRSSTASSCREPVLELSVAQRTGTLASS